MDFDRRAQVATAVVIVALLFGSFAYYTDVGATVKSSTTSTSSTQSTVIDITNPGGSTTSTATSAVASSTSSTVRTVVSSTTVACVPGGTPGAASAPPTTLPDYIPLFSTVSAMTMFVQQVVVDQYNRVNSSTAIVSYKVAGTTTMDGTRAYEVELTVSANETSYASVNGTSNSGQAIAYFDSDGDLLQFSQTNSNETGSTAVTSAIPYLDWYDYELVTASQLANYQNPNSETNINQTAVTVGPTSMNVTYAEPKAMPYSVSECGATTVIENVLFAYGTVPGTSTPVITFYYSLGSDGAANEAFAYKVVSVTPG